MRIFNEDKTIELNENELDFKSGHLVNDVLITHIQEQPAVEEQSHYEIVTEYSNGGKDVELVIDVVGQPYIAEHDETEDILVYKPYTEQEIKNIKNNNRIAELKQKLQETDYKAIKYAEGELTEEEYAETKAQRKSWREEINRLEEELKDGSNTI